MRLPQLHSLPADPSVGCAESVARAAPRALRPHILGYCGFRTTAVGRATTAVEREAAAVGREAAAVGREAAAVGRATAAAVERATTAVGRAPRRILPLNLTTVIVDVRTGAGLVSGPRREPVVDELADWCHGVSIGLTPAGAPALLGVPSRDLVGATVRLDELLGRRAAELADRLGAAPDWAARFAVLDEVLAGWLRPDGRADGVVTRAWWRLQEPAGRLTIGALADELGVSRRRVELGFQRQIGLSPKTVARITRFQHAVSLLRGPARGAGVATACGFADQAHLTREIRELAGVTPTELFAFLQDRPDPVR